MSLSKSTMLLFKQLFTIFKGSCSIIQHWLMMPFQKAIKLKCSDATVLSIMTLRLLIKTFSIMKQHKRLTCGTQHSNILYRLPLC
jgi:hypothetical protein